MIKGLDCNFVEFIPSELKVRGENGEIKEGKGQDIFITKVNK